MITQGKLDGAQQLCIQENVPVARLVSKGLSRIGRPLEDINTAIENAGRLEVYQLEKNISILSYYCWGSSHVGIFRYSNWDDSFHL